MDELGETTVTRTDGVLEIRGARIAYSDEGDGPLVINAHGLTQGRGMADSFGVIDPAAVVGAGYRVVTYDARGHGDSTGAPDPDSYRWTSLADDLLAVADRFSPDAPVRAMGVSMGTGTVLTAAVRAPERFQALVLGAPPTAWATRAPQGAVYERFAQLVEETTPERFAALLKEAPIAPIFADVPSFPAAPTPSSELLPAIFRGAGRSDLPAIDELRAVAVPALILAWATDPGHPVSTAEMLHETLQSSSLHVSTDSSDIRTWGERAAAFFAAPA